MEKTIRMPQKMLTDWLAALRSGEYKQATDIMFDDSTGGYCCLGVLQKVVDGDVERISDGVPYQAPSGDWVRRNGVTFRDDRSPYPRGNYMNPYLPSLRDSAAGANDKGVPFSMIADAIEACAEGY